MDKNTLLARALDLGTQWGMPEGFPLLVAYDTEGTIHLAQRRGGTACPSWDVHLHPVTTLSAADLPTQKNLCADCLSGSANNAKDGEGDAYTNVLLLLLGAVHHQDLRLQLEAAAENASGSELLGRAVSLDQDHQWLRAGAAHTRKPHGSLPVPLESVLACIESFVDESTPVIRKVVQKPEVRTAALLQVPAPKRPRSKGKRRQLDQAPPEPSTTGTKLLVWAGTRRELRLEHSVGDLTLILVWLVHEDRHNTVVQVSGKTADHLLQRSRRRPVQVVDLDEGVTPTEVETALGLWQEGNGPLGTLTGALEAARSVLA